MLPVLVFAGLMAGFYYGLQIDSTVLPSALIDEPAPRGVSAEGLMTPGHGKGLRAAVVFAHPHTEHGGTMHTKVVYQASKALSRIGCAVLRFNFRGAGASPGSFTNGPGEMDDFRAALDFLHDRYAEAPMWAGGMSFGSYVALTVGAEDPRVSTLIGIALPIARYDFEPVARSSKPKFFKANPTSSLTVSEKSR